MASIESIAQKLRLSRMTVSRALRGVPGVAAPTRERVLAMAESMGYQPNPLVSAWMNRVRSNRAASFQATIAYCLFHRDSTQKRQHLDRRGYLHGAQAAAEAHGFRVETFWLEPSMFTPERMRQVFQARGITGLLIHPINSTAERLCFRWETDVHEAFKIVLLSSTLPRYRMDRVFFDHAGGMQTVLKELRLRGFRRPGLALSFRADIQARHLWSTSFVSRHVSHPAPALPPMWLERKLNSYSFLSWIRRERPDVVIGLEEPFCHWLEQLEQEEGEAPPFVHLDGEFAPTRRVLAALFQDSEQVGYEAARLLIYALTHPAPSAPAVVRTVLMEGRVVWR